MDFKILYTLLLICFELLPSTITQFIISKQFVKVNNYYVVHNQVQVDTFQLRDGSDGECCVRCSLTDSTGFSFDLSSSQCHCYQSSCLALDYNVMIDNAKSFYIRAELTLSPYCHTLIPTSRTWFDARDDCISRAMDLADIADEAEQTYIRNVLIDKAIDRDVWFGLTDEAEEDVFISISKGENATYYKWHSGEPNNDNALGGSENCVWLRESRDWEWFDADCDPREAYYLCEHLYD